MRIYERIIKEITVESYLPSEIHEKVDELINEGYSFTPYKSFRDSKNQTVHYTIGRKELGRE